MRLLRALVLASLALSLPSCRYLGNRAADFLDQFRGAVGVGTVAGVRARAVGVVDTGIMMGVKPRAAALGWRYGTPLAFRPDRRADADQAEIFRTTSIDGLDYAAGSYRSARTSAAVLPAVFTWTDATPTRYEWLVPGEGEDFDDRHWIWSRESRRQNRHARIHAFDVEAEVGLFVYLDAGFSPGECLDFLLGFLGIDIAKDDRPRKRDG